MPSEATVDAIINNAISLANAQTNSANQAAQAAMTASMGFAVPNVSPVIYSVSASEPAMLDTQDSTLTYEAQLEKLIELLSGQLGTFFTNYYPLVSDAYDEATAWLVNTITNGGTGINPVVEDQIWQRGRDRIVRDGLRVESQTQADFARRGFRLPPGVLAARLSELRFEQLTKTQEFSRDVAIKQFETEIETLKFAVQTAIDSRLRALSAASDYIRAFMSAPDAAARVASLNADAKARMMSATADLYRARLSRDEIAMRVPLANSNAEIQSSGLRMDGFYKGIDARVRAAAAAADSYGSTAAAALSSLNSVASISSASFS